MNRIIAAALLFLLAFTARAADRKPYTRNVAVVVYENAEPLDWSGPFEVYNDAAGFGVANGQNAFNVYIVSKTTEPLNAQGLKVVPNYSIANAPKPDIVIFPGGPSQKITDDPEFFAWAKKASIEAEIAQSVCTGAFVLGNAGLLDNLEVTTWYGAISQLQQKFPKTTVKDGRRFVDNGHIVTTAGISAGIDGSLHIVARLLGRRVADQVSRYMEYHWTPESYLSTNYAYLNPSTDDRGRLTQTAEMRREENDHLASAQTYVKVASLARPEESEHLANTLYNAACEFALADHVDESFDYLKKAYAAGFKDRNAIKTDPDLARLRNDPRVQELVASK